MTRDSMQEMRLDRRLIHRQGWMKDEEIQSELEALPDAAAKATTLGEAEAEADRGQGAPETPPAPETPSF